MKKLVAYITASYPSSSFTVDLALRLKEAGVDYLELGIPFSDPVADGPIIEKVNLKALKNGFKIENLFEISQKIGNEIDTFWMGYFNPFYRKGLDNFIKEAKKSGIKGFIIPDLPYEEAKEYQSIFKESGLSLISLLPQQTQKREL